MEYKKLLTDAINYAKKMDSWSKKLMTQNADVVCAYGLGQYFRDVFNHPQWNLKEYLHINYCCDKNTVHGEGVARKYGIKYIDFDSLVKINKSQNVVVVLFVGNAKDLEGELRSKGLNVITLGEVFFEKLCDMPSDPAWFGENKLLRVYDCLEDEESKKVFVNALVQRLAPMMATHSYSDLKSDGEYFKQDFFPLSQDEIFCDCGAYTGDTVERFLKAVNGNFAYIYAFEMAEENYKRLVDCVDTLSMEYKELTPDKYSLLNAGVWDSKGVLFYGKEEKGSNESYGVFKTDNQMPANVVTLDETIDGPVTFIKMDIEGAELNALSGGANVIKKYTPKLAICLYHRLQDFWLIPLYVKQLVPEYKLYVRHHQDDLGGTVLYAVAGD